MAKLRQQITQVVRGITNSFALSLWGPPALPIENAMIIAGYPRSGTTWLMEVMARVPGVGVIFEPLNIDKVPSAKAAGLDWRNFHLPDEVWPSGEEFMRQVLIGKVRNPWTLSSMTLPQTIGINAWVIKMVRANQMLLWLHETFALKPSILLIRHPCAVYASRSSRGWAAPQYTPKKSAFFRTYPYLLDFVNTLTMPEEHFAARWCMNYYPLIYSPPPFPFHTVFYESLVQNPEAEISEILGLWDIPPPENFVGHLKVPSNKAGENMITAGARIDSWVKKLDPEISGRITRVVEAFGLDFYSDNPAPNLNRFRSLFRL